PKIRQLPKLFTLLKKLKQSVRHLKYLSIDSLLGTPRLSLVSPFWWPLVHHCLARHGRHGSIKDLPSSSSAVLVLSSFPRRLRLSPQSVKPPAAVYSFKSAPIWNKSARSMLLPLTKPVH